MKEDESPGMETLERLERTSFLMGKNRQLRTTELLLQPYQYKGTNIGLLSYKKCVVVFAMVMAVCAEMNIECYGESIDGYKHIFSRGIKTLCRDSTE